MQSIPADLNEAAAVDGAGMFTRFFKITLPQLKSVSLVIVFIHIIWNIINIAVNKIGRASCRERVSSTV